MFRYQVDLKINYTNTFDMNIPIASQMSVTLLPLPSPDGFDLILTCSRF